LTEETKSSDSKLAEASISDDEEEGTIDEDGKEEDSSDEMEDLDEDVEDQKGTSSKTTGQSVAGKTRWSKEEEDDGRNGKIGAVAGALGPALNKDLAAKEGSKLTAPDQRAQRHLSRLESLCVRFRFPPQSTLSGPDHGMHGPIEKEALSSSGPTAGHSRQSWSTGCLESRTMQALGGPDPC